jgi:hypothetical protein
VNCRKPWAWRYRRPDSSNEDLRGNARREASSASSVHRGRAAAIRAGNAKPAKPEYGPMRDDLRWPTIQLHHERNPRSCSPPLLCNGFHQQDALRASARFQLIVGSRSSSIPSLRQAMNRFSRRTVQANNGLLGARCLHQSSKPSLQLSRSSLVSQGASKPTRNALIRRFSNSAVRLEEGGPRVKIYNRTGVRIVLRGM